MDNSLNPTSPSSRAWLLLALLAIIAAAANLPIGRARAVLLGAPPVSSMPTPTSDNKIFGVTLSGGEFGEGNLPGTIFRDYTYPSDVAVQRYFHGNGQTLIRVPFRWERVQRDAAGPLSMVDISGLL